MNKVKTLEDLIKEQSEVAKERICHDLTRFKELVDRQDWRIPHRKCIDGITGKPRQYRLTFVPKYTEDGKELSELLERYGDTKFDCAIQLEDYFYIEIEDYICTTVFGLFSDTKPGDTAPNIIARFPI